MVKSERLTPRQLRYVRSYCRMYREWRAMIATCDASKGIRYDLPRVQTSAGDSSTETLGIRRAALQTKVDIIEDAVRSVTESEVLQGFILLGITEPMSYERLTVKGIPCGRTLYHQLRSQALFLIAQKI